jgi:hypothetical protein
LRKQIPYYNSIENLPCAIFDKINQTSDYSLLIINPNSKIRRKNLEKVWAIIYNEFIATFGMADNFKIYLQRMGEYVQCLNNAYVNGDRSQITMAEVKKAQAEAMLNISEKKNPYAIVSKYMGFRCLPNEVTVKEFYSYLSLMK